MYDEWGVRYSRWFVILFAAVSVASLASIPFVPAKLWLTFAIASFALLEGIGLWRHRDSLPPLTYISRRYLPRWATVTIVGFFTGLAGGYWFGLNHPVGLASLLGLYSWAQDHFDVTYDD